MITVEICVGSSCHIRGSAYIINEIQNYLKDNGLADQVDFKASFCMGDCKNGVCMNIGGEKVRNVSAANIASVIEKEIAGRLK